ncbi:MAG TPA: hypothetical protein VG184_04975 [Acidimicrobiales bacterium]|nr:hypothetical protein [Acidimicrobiales bacterium]
MTRFSLCLIDVLVAWPGAGGASRAARRVVSAWAGDPVLAPFASPGAAALACREPDRASPDPDRDRQDQNGVVPERATHPARVLAALAARPDDNWATTAALAGVAPRLAVITRRWRRDLKGHLGRSRLSIPTPPGSPARRHLRSALGRGAFRGR